MTDKIDYGAPARLRTFPGYEGDVDLLPSTVEVFNLADALRRHTALDPRMRHRVAIAVPAGAAGDKTLLWRRDVDRIVARDDFRRLQRRRLALA